MPGMMDTILNLGLNDEAVEGLAARTGNRRFAYDSYRRLIQMFGEVVDGIDGHAFEDALTALKRERGAKLDTDLTADDLAGLVETYRGIYRAAKGTDFPQDGDRPADARGQRRVRLVGHAAREGLPPRERHPRRPRHGGQRRPDGVRQQGRPLRNRRRVHAQPVDRREGGLRRVPRERAGRGRRRRHPHAAARRVDGRIMPDAYEQLLATMRRLEEHYRDMQDVEFTVEDDVLYMLQTRAAKRTAAAAIKAAVDMVDEGVISREEAVVRIDPAQLDQLLHPRIDPDTAPEPVAKGLNASPGAASGAIVFDADTAVERAKGEPVILVRYETTPDDIHGMIAAQGILTVHGGMTSHAAVVARGMGKPCVAGCEGLTIEDGVVRLGGHELREGDVITIDGGSGTVYLGRIELVPPQLNDDFQTILGWADAFRRLHVRANADTPADAVRAREFGAEGIGLCRTEHMFFGDERLPVMQEMILADTETGAPRRARPAPAVPAGGLRRDLRGDGGAAGDDPAARPAAARVPAARGSGGRRADARPHPRRCTSRTRCSGCAAAASGSCTRRSTRCRSARSPGPRSPSSSARGEAPHVEIMHPLVGFAEELRRLRELTERVWAEEAPATWRTRSGR